MLNNSVKNEMDDIDAYLNKNDLDIDKEMADMNNDEQLLNEFKKDADSIHE